MADDVLDIQQILDAFGEIDDDVRDMMRLFVKTTAPLLDRIDTTVASRDQTAAEHAAHSAKGAARSAGARLLAGVCESIEQAVRRGDWPEAERQLPLARPAFAAASAAIDRL